MERQKEMSYRNPEEDTESAGGSFAFQSKNMSRYNMLQAYLSIELGNKSMIMSEQVIDGIPLALVLTVLLTCPSGHPVQ